MGEHAPTGAQGFGLPSGSSGGARLRAIGPASGRALLYCGMAGSLPTQHKGGGVRSTPTGGDRKGCDRR